MPPKQAIQKNVVPDASKVHGVDSSAQTLALNGEMVDNGDQMRQEEAAAERRGGDQNSGHDHVSMGRILGSIVRRCNKLMFRLEGEAPSTFEEDQQTQPNAHGENGDVDSGQVQYAWIGSQFGK